MAVANSKTKPKAGTKPRTKSKSTAKPPGKWERSEGYRSEFMKRNKGFFGKLYFCVYCGKPITAKNMQVDHHIAINYVKKNPLLKLYFGISNSISNFFGSLFHGKKWKKNTGVNVSYNLVPACKRCNRLKSDKGGLWIIRGMIGGTIWKLLNFINNIFFTLFKTPLGPIILIAGIGAVIYFTPLGSMLLSLF